MKEDAVGSLGKARAWFKSLSKEQQKIVYEESKKFAEDTVLRIYDKFMWKPGDLILLEKGK